jgi:hypothetical protein
MPAHAPEEDPLVFRDDEPGPVLSGHSLWLTPIGARSGTQIHCRHYPFGYDLRPRSMTNDAEK